MMTAFNTGKSPGQVGANLGRDSAAHDSALTKSKTALSDTKTAVSTFETF